MGISRKLGKILINYSGITTIFLRISLKENGEYLKTDLTTTNISNKYFLTVAETLEPNNPSSNISP